MNELFVFTTVGVIVISGYAESTIQVPPEKPIYKLMITGRDELGGSVHLLTLHLLSFISVSHRQLKKWTSGHLSLVMASKTENKL